MSADLFTASATDVLRRFHSRELSPVEYLGALIARIEAVGADVNALGIVLLTLLMTLKPF